VEAGSWSLGSLGEAGAWRLNGECRFEDGLRDDLNREFLAGVRTHHGLVPLRVDISLPYLWFHDAIPVEENNWIHLNASGEELPLIRTTIFGDRHWTVEFAALPLRRFLAATQRCLVVKHDIVVLGKSQLEQSSFFVIANDWAAFEVDLRSDGISPDYASFVRILGASIVRPLDVDVCAEEEQQRDQGPFPEFIYTVDPKTGQPLSWTCEEDRLSSYFEDRKAPHYLTPVYFRKEVLARYVQQPAKYRVSKGGISCLDLWSLRMDMNPEGLVEVYLGDLGTYLPAAEREYWRRFNVPPSGGMNVDRYQRDFLAQWVFSKDSVRELLDARHGVDRAFRERFGRPLYRPLAREDESSFSGLHLMTTNDPAEFDRVLIVLAKGVVDALDVSILRLVTKREEGTSLQLLETLVQDLQGDPSKIVGSLRNIQALRSSGSAHTRGGRYEKIIADLGLSRTPLPGRFEQLVLGCVTALRALEELLSREGEGASEDLAAE